MPPISVIKRYSAFWNPWVSKSLETRNFPPSNGTDSGLMRKFNLNLNSLEAERAVAKYLFSFHLPKIRWQPKPHFLRDSVHLSIRISYSDTNCLKLTEKARTIKCYKSNRIIKSFREFGSAAFCFNKPFKNCGPRSV